MIGIGTDVVQRGAFGLVLEAGILAVGVQVVQVDVAAVVGVARQLDGVAATGEIDDVTGHAPGVPIGQIRELKLRLVHTVHVDTTGAGAAGVVGIAEGKRVVSGLGHGDAELDVVA